MLSVLEGDKKLTDAAISVYDDRLIMVLAFTDPYYDAAMWPVIDRMVTV